MTSTGASGIANSPLPKWQLCLAVGAPVAIGLGYMYYRSISSSKPSFKPGRGKPKIFGKENGAGDKQISIDGDTTDSTKTDTIETPAELAQKYKLMGNKFFKEGKYDEAIAHYNQAIEMCPKNNTEDLATFFQNRAAAYELLKKYSAVKEDCTRALVLNPKYIKALARRARAFEINNELQSALEDIMSVCILEKCTNQNSLILADKILKELGKQHAEEYMANKKPVMPSKHFIATYFQAFCSDPIISETKDPNLDEDKTLFGKALRALRDENYDEIIRLCTKELSTLSADENSLHKMMVLLLRGTFHLLLGQYDETILDFDEVINSEVASNNLKVNALIKRASMQVQLQNPEKSFCDFAAAIELDPQCGDIYHNRGQVHLLLDNVDEAKRDLEMAVELNPNFGIAHVQKCYTDYRYASKASDPHLMTAAIADFNKAIEKFPDCAECYTLYAQLLSDSQDFAQADKYFAKASEKDPKNATIYVHRGLLQLQWRSNVEKAVEYIKSAIELDDKCEYGYETLGSIEVQRGNVEEGIKLFEKALSLARTQMELIHIFSLRDAAKTQMTVTNRLGQDSMWPLQGMP